MALPLLGDEPGGGLPDAHGAVASVRPEARALAARNWIACVGLGEDAARFACALSSALATHPRYALLTQHAPAALVDALRRSGAEPLRCLQPVDEPEPIQEQLRALPAGALVIVVESALASRLRGVLDVWVGRPPSLDQSVQLTPLHAAADLRVSAQAEDVARALGDALAKTLI